MGLLLLLPFLITSVEAIAEDEKALFSKGCSACHTLNFNSSQRQGPTLDRVIGRKAGSIKNFPYSDGLKNAEWDWTPERLDKWLINPQDVIPDSYMLYRQTDPIVRKKIINFLQSDRKKKQGK